jgi:hypothetical protein
VWPAGHRDLDRELDLAVALDRPPDVVSGNI